MELTYTQTNLTLSSCLLAVALALGACGDESKPEGDDDNTAEEGKADAGSKPADSGSKPADSGSKPTDSGSKPEDSGSKPADSGKAEADASSTTSGNTIYTGGPECPNIGRKISGTVDGNEVSYELSTQSEGDDTYFEAGDSSSDTGLLRLEWEPAIDSSGKPAEINDGELRLPSTYAFGPYCVLAGKAQRDSKLDEEDGYREFYTITKVKKKTGSTCSGTGAELAADLKVCTNYR